MAIIEWSRDETVAVVHLNNGENRQNLEFVKAFEQVLDEILADPAVAAMVILSTDPKFWSYGIDIDWLGKQLQEQNFHRAKAFLYGMNAIFKKLLLLPVPAIAAINGHAFGNGAILACACDFRFMKSDRGYFCFPEVDLGVPFLPGMLAFIKKAVPLYKFNEMMLTGKRAVAPELEAHHVIEKACADDAQLQSEVMTFARTFHKKRGIFAEHKKRLYQEIIEIMDHQDTAYIESLSLMNP